MVVKNKVPPIDPMLLVMESKATPAVVEYRHVADLFVINEISITELFAANSPEGSPLANTGAVDAATTFTPT